MILWLDAQLPPSAAMWMETTFGISCHAVRDLGLRDATDDSIFQAARNRDAVVVTKDKDFVDLLDRFGPPPQVIWLTCGNTSNARLREILLATLPAAIQWLEQGEILVEVGDGPPRGITPDESTG